MGMDTITPNDTQTELLPIFTIPATVLPGELFPLHIFEQKYRALISHCLGNNDAQKKYPFGIIATTDKTHSSYGCLVEIADVLLEFDDGRSVILTSGIKPFRVISLYGDGTFPIARVSYIEELAEAKDSELRTATLDLFTEVLDRGGYEVRIEAQPEHDLAYYLASAIQLDPAEREELLREPSENRRLRRLNDFLGFRLRTLESTYALEHNLLFDPSDPILH